MHGPWLYICRHEHEPPLLQQLRALGAADARVLVPGLVEARPSIDDVTLAPSWALQVLPRVQWLPMGSVRTTAHAIVDAIAAPLDEAPSWALHALLPGTLRGNPRPPGEHHRDLLLAAIAERMQAIRKRTWRRRVAGSGADVAWLVQLMLLEGRIGVSVAATTTLAVGSRWPSVWPAGHLPVADDPQAPASSFRKLEEAFGVLHCWPRPGDVGIDLGASPGGWTRVLRRYGASVVAVDRAALAPTLQRDPKVRWLGGDAFRFDPAEVLRPGERVDWLVSDIVAFPERIVELLSTLPRLGGADVRGPRRFVVQMKFRGEVDHAALAAGLAAASASGYHAVARHLFHDKNEITLVGVRHDAAETP